MRRGRTWLALAGVALAAAALGVSRAQEMPVFPKREAPPPPKYDFDPKLPSLGMKVTPFPEGPGNRAVTIACLRCHSADIVLQQRLTVEQWRSELDRMIEWGAFIPPGKKPEILAYLTKNFGPANRGFAPTKVRPAGH